MAYIDTKHLFKCGTCRMRIDGRCNAWCESGESYSPDMSKIPGSNVVEVESISEQIIRKKAEVSDYWQNDVKSYRAMQGYSDIEHDVDNFLRGYNEAVEDILTILDSKLQRKGVWNDVRIK